MVISAQITARTAARTAWAPNLCLNARMRYIYSYHPNIFININIIKYYGRTMKI